MGVKPNTVLLTGNKWWNRLPVRSSQADRIADMSEDLGVAHADKGQFTEIGVCREIFKGMQRRSQEAVCLIRVRLITRGAVCKQYLERETTGGKEGATNTGVHTQCTFPKCDGRVP
jgi:hypothetical protein